MNSNWEYYYNEVWDQLGEVADAANKDNTLAERIDDMISDIYYNEETSSYLCSRIIQDWYYDYYKPDHEDEEELEK